MAHQVDGLSTYKPYIEKVAQKSPLADEIPKMHRLWHSSFETLYELVRQARNDAMHQGAFVRHATENSVQLSLILEDALMATADKVGDFMIREPVCAMAWHPLSYVRQVMLKNAFTYLPFMERSNGGIIWKLVSDYHLADYLRATANRNKLLGKTLAEAVSGGLTLGDVKTCSPNTHLAQAIKMSQGLPLLVVDRKFTERLIGILSPFDLL
jgi:CBS domain-containing protein